MDGLVNFKKAQGTAAYTVVPDLAVAIPKPTDGGKTWVFKLRPGIKFSNGKVLKASDVVASFQRIFKVHGPTAASFYGVDRRRRRRASRPPRRARSRAASSRDDAKGTVTFHLTKPDGEWLQQLAVPLASVVPAGDAAEGPGRQVGARHRART